MLCRAKDMFPIAHLHLLFNLRLMLLVIAVFAYSATAAGTEGVLEVIAETGDPSPDGVSKISSFTYHGNRQAPDFIHAYYTPVINDDGQVAYWASMGDSLAVYSGDQATFVGTPETTRIVARTGQPIDDDGMIPGGLPPPQIDPHGNVWFTTAIALPNPPASVDYGLIYGSASGNEVMLGPVEPAPDGDGDIYRFNSPAANADGRVAFIGPMRNGAAGVPVDQGVFVYDNGALRQVVRKSDLTPYGVATFEGFESPAINSSGDLAFYATTSQGVGLFLEQDNAIYQVGRVGLPTTPGENPLTRIGPYPWYEQPALNDLGQVAFQGFRDDGMSIYLGDANDVVQLIGSGFEAVDGNGVAGTFGLFGFNHLGQTALMIEFGGTTGADHPNGGKVDDLAVYRVSSSETIQIARESELTPDGSAHYASFEGITLNEQGLIVFNAGLTPQPGQFSVDRGVFLSDGIETVEAVRYFDSIGGDAIRTIRIGGHGFFDDTFGETFDPAHRPLNNHGQVTFFAQTGGDNEVVGRFTPDLHWRITGNGSWDDRMNWTLSLQPHWMHRVVIDPEASVEIAGPASDVEIRSLQLGADDSMPATLRLDGASGALRAREEVVITSVGTVDLDGGFLAAPMVANRGQIRGGGQIDGSLVHESGSVLPGAAVPLDITGDYTQMADATLAIELSESTFSALQIRGDAQLGGGFDVEVDPLGLTLGQSFEILTIDGQSNGIFNEVPNGAVIGNFPDFDLRIDYHAGDGNDVALVATWPGDFDLDFDVDGADFLAWQRNPSVGTLADWQANFGMSIPWKVTKSVVPEPVTLTLCLAAACFILTVRRAG